MAPFTIPATLQLLMGATVEVDAAGMILDMLFMIAIPALLGTALNDRTKGRAKKQVSPVLAPLARILTILVITTNSTSLSTFIFNLTPELAGVLVLIGFLASSGYVWGFLAARLMHLKRADAVGMTFLCAMKNISAGAIIAQEEGVSTPYALNNIQERAQMFIGPQTHVYEGMIVGQNSRSDDMIVNPCKAKKASNMRAAGSDDAVKLSPFRKFSLEEALEWIGDDELVEVTPTDIRLRKKILNELERRRAGRWIAPENR